MAKTNVKRRHSERRLSTARWAFRRLDEISHTHSLNVDSTPQPTIFLHRVYMRLYPPTSMLCVLSLRKRCHQQVLGSRSAAAIVWPCSPQAPTSCYTQVFVRPLFCSADRVSRTPRPMFILHSQSLRQSTFYFSCRPHAPGILPMGLTSTNSPLGLGGHIPPATFRAEVCDQDE